MKNRKIALTFASLGSALLLAACGEPKSPTASSVASTNGSEETSQSSVITEKTKISFWVNWNDNFKGVVQGFIDNFEAENPDVEVELKKIEGSYDGLLTQTINGYTGSNDYPDILLAYPDSVQRLITYGIVANCKPMMEDATYGWTDEDRDDFVPAYLEEGESYPLDGVYSLPLAKSTEAMWYNPKIIGLQLSGVNGGNAITEEYINNLTWEEMMDNLLPAIETYNNSLSDDKKLYQLNADTKVGLVGYDSDANFFITLCEQYGYTYTSMNKSTEEGELSFYTDEATRKGMSDLLVKFHDWNRKRYFFTGSYGGSKGYTNSFTNVDTGLPNALFAIGSTAGLSHQYSTTYHPYIAKIPTAAGHDKKVINQGPSVAILRHKNANQAWDTNRQMAAWRFIKYMTNPTNSTNWAIATNYLPLRESTFSTSAWQEYSAMPEDKNTDTFMTASQSHYAETISDDLFASPVFTGSSTARTQVGGVVTSALTADTLTANDVTALLKTAYENTLKDM